MSRTLAALLTAATLALGACDDGSDAALYVDLTTGVPVFFDTGANERIADSLIVYEITDCQGRSMTMSEVWDVHQSGEALLDGITYGEAPEGARSEDAFELIEGREYYVQLGYHPKVGTLTFDSNMGTSGFFIAGIPDSFRAEGPHTKCDRDFDANPSN